MIIGEKDSLRGESCKISIFECFVIVLLYQKEAQISRSRHSQAKFDRNG